MTMHAQDQVTLDVSDGEYTATPRWSRRASMVRQDLRALLAASFPVKPPSQYFANPKFSRLTPLTVESTGRVYGHVAGWRTAHIGMAGSIRAPRSTSDYAYFKSGQVECEDGSMVSVGQITLTGGHAPLSASTSETVRHYDDTASAVMDVTVGEDKHGIWVSGALRPSVTDEQIRAVRASGISGDWRPVNGQLELVAICSVPVPGFPIPRARVAAGVPVALVAAGTDELVRLAMRRSGSNELDKVVASGFETINGRLSRLEQSVLSRAAAVRSSTTVQTLIASARTAIIAGGEQDKARQELRKRVHPVVASTEADDTATTPEPHEEPSTVADLAKRDALRSRVHAGRG